LSYLIKIINHEADMRVCHLFQLPFGIHSSATGGCIHFLEQCHQIR